MWREVWTAVALALAGIVGAFGVAWLAWRRWDEPGELPGAFGAALAPAPVEVIPTEVEHRGADEDWSPAADVAEQPAVELTGEPVLFDPAAWDALTAELGAVLDAALTSYETELLTRQTWYGGPHNVESTDERIDRWLREGGALTDSLHGQLATLVAE